MLPLQQQASKQASGSDQTAVCRDSVGGGIARWRCSCCGGRSGRAARDARPCTLGGTARCRTRTSATAARRCHLCGRSQLVAPCRDRHSRVAHIGPLVRLCAAPWEVGLGAARALLAHGAAGRQHAVLRHSEPLARRRHVHFVR
jgi:hypothetical protein